MPKRLFRGHRSLQIGAALAGASLLALGIASPAFAAQNVNNGNADNATAQNYLITEGGAQASYGLMLAEANIFNQAPGCDLLSLSGSEQALDYGCPGLNSEVGLTQAPAQTVPLTGVAITSGSKKFVISGAVGNTNIGPGTLVTDNAGVIPVADPVKTFNSATGKIKLEFASTGNAASDTLTFNYNPQQGEDGYTTWGNENPFNDFLAEEPSYGSGNGIQELEGTGSASAVGHSNNTDDPTGTGPVPVAPVDSARSSRAPKLTSGGDFQGMNFVAYAEDAVSFLYWKNYNGTATTASNCLSSIGAANISTSVLKSIWAETYNTSGVPNLTWSSLDPGNSACPATPVYAYWAANNTGTESTWASTTGASFPGASSHWPSDQIIFENETASILKNAATVPIGDVLFFYSYGNFNKTCTPSSSELSTSVSCAGTSTNASVPNSVQLGTQINGITLNQTSINSQLPGLETSAFPGDRLLYNVYSDGSNPNLPVSSPATLNALSEDGFLCKPATTTDVDPSTGSTYRSEIDAAITGEGFFPLPNLQVEDGQGDTAGGYASTKSGIPNPAWNVGLSASKYNAANETSSPWNFAAANVDTDNSAVSGTYGNVEDGSSTLGTQTASATAPVGYCITESSDSSAAGQ